MNKVRKKAGATPKQRTEFLLFLKSKYKTKREIFDVLAESCGSTNGTVSKWFLDPKSSNYRDCPYAVWRCWMIDTQYQSAELNIPV